MTQIESNRKYKENHREEVAANQRRYRKENGKKNLRESRKRKYLLHREIIDNYKKQHPCRCGILDYRVLTFHHRNPEEKSFQISSKIGSVGTKTLLKEIAKCDILCANCHTIEHFED